MILLTFETPHFTFRAFGNTKFHAKRTLDLAWAAHAQQTGADRHYVRDHADGIEVTEFEPGECFRDDSVIVSNGIAHVPDRT